MHDILKYFDPKFKPRDVQSEFLKFVSENIDEYDVIVGNLPTGAGKSHCNAAIAQYFQLEYQRKSSIITPTNILQEQMARDFPFPTLKGMRCYRCREGKNCKSCFEKTGKVCDSCVWAQARNAALISPITVCNFASYNHYNMHRDILIIDEAHSAIESIIREFTITLSKKQDQYPDSKWEDKVASINVLIPWLQSQIAMLGESIKMLKEDTSLAPEVHAGKIEELQSRQNLYRNVINLLEKHPLSNIVIAETIKKNDRSLSVGPVDISELAGELLWPKDKVRKIILTSATFNHIDAELLGLHNYKTAYFNGASPIPAENRPFIYYPLIDLSYKGKEEGIPKLPHILKLFADKHKGQKGLVHTTYEIAEKLSYLMKQDKRFIFHSRTNKTAKYKEFLADTGDRILVASGMSEGIDLPDELGEWQVITHPIYANLGDPMVKARKEKYSNWYKYHALKTVEQTAGRICRHEKDKGVTYIIGTTWTLLNNMTRDLQYEWFKDCKYNMSVEDFEQRFGKLEG